jgi:hypothetical protein
VGTFPASDDLIAYNSHAEREVVTSLALLILDTPYASPFDVEVFGERFSAWR